MATAVTDPLSVLIVEDNVGAAAAFQAVFHVHGHDAAVAHDGSEALEIMRRNPPDVVLCNLGLPDMDGYRVVEALRSDPAIPYRPICALSARTDEASRRQAAEAGFDGYIVKPPRFPELLDFLKRCRR
jgi:two-component system CheB/CheR fusion protein